MWDVEWESYGSGFASFVAVVVGPGSPQGQGVAPNQWFEGVIVALCRLAPVACVSSPGLERARAPGLPGQGSFLGPEHTGWQAVDGAIDRALRGHGIDRLPAVVLNQAIDSELTIDTNLGDAPFTVFDAWFHWWD